MYSELAESYTMLRVSLRLYGMTFSLVELKAFSVKCRVAFLLFYSTWTTNENPYPWYGADLGISTVYAVKKLKKLACSG